MLTDEQKTILARARATYGDVAQLLVSIEELNELACVCAKYPRYNNRYDALDKLYEKAVDEVADTLIVLDHIINIFGITDERLKSRIKAKCERLNRWLEDSKDLQHTTEDREVKEGVTNETV